MTLCACGQPSPAAFICAGCEHQLARALLAAAAMAPDLEDAVARLMRRGNGGHGGREVPLLVDPGAMAARDALKNTLLTWTRVFVTDEWPSDDIASIAFWLVRRLDRIRLHPAAGEMASDVHREVERAQRAIDRKPDSMYAGPCPRCGADLLGEPGVSVITCSCGAHCEVSDQQDAMMSALWDMLGSVQWCVTAAGACGVRIPEGTAYSWIQRSQLVAHGSRPSMREGAPPVPLYRFGDMIELAARGPRGTKRAARAS